MNSFLILFILGFAIAPHQGFSSSKKICSQKERDNLQTKKNFLESQNPIADEMTRKLEREFEKSSAQVVLLGNVGKDISDRDIETPSHINMENNPSPNKYMHGGLAYRIPGTKEWKIIHLLNVYDNCGNMTGKSTISNNNLRTFFARPHYKMDVQMQIPSPQLQKNILKTILESSEELHESQYSAIANPKSLKYQNSNQFILDIISTAQKETPLCQQAILEAKQRGKINDKTKARREAQLCAFVNGYKPAIMNAKTYESFGVSFGLKPEISLDDHSYSSQRSSKYPWVSFLSLSDYLKKTDPSSTHAEYIYPSVGRNKTKHELYVNYITQQNKNNNSEENK